jgi:hypothetical protein
MRVRIDRLKCLLEWWGLANDSGWRTRWRFGLVLRWRFGLVLRWRWGLVSRRLVNARIVHPVHRRSMAFACHILLGTPDDR